MRREPLSVFSPLLLIFYLFSPQLSAAEEIADLSDGQTIYVPAYSHIYVGNEKVPVSLTVTTSIRNTDPDNSITVTKVDYYETQGMLVKRFINANVTLKPLGSIQYVVPHKDEAGGAGANFIVEWKSSRPVNPPIIETIMIGQQGISFTSRGRALSRTK